MVLPFPMPMNYARPTIRFVGLWRSLVLAAVAVALAMPRAHAQDRSARSGMWLSGGLGAGLSWASIETLGIETNPGVTFNVRAGFTLSPHVLVGAELNAMPKPHNTDCFVGPCVGIDGAFAALGVVLWYPSASGGWYVKGGAGMVDGYMNFGLFLWDNAAWVGHLGAGYDLRPSKGFSLSPYAALQLWPVDGGGTINLVTIGIGFTVQ